ncbi:hypothetical protein ANBU17_06110 [Anaerostipes butyraticus]|uniref:Uncharacterized protein n=1 Tax=Anaerostipes butyraticus TaxID=645466 RepID=A0A916VBQ6_9FIRM|nr:hypothetical protein ANBU17_06110 [Anaerostipes butyraticus]
MRQSWEQMLLEDTTANHKQPEEERSMKRVFSLLFLTQIGERRSSSIDDVEGRTHFLKLF